MTMNSALITAAQNFLQDPEFSSYRLELVSGHWRVTGAKGLSFEIDFDDNKKDYFRKNTQGSQDLLIKALRGEKKHTRVLDLTAGLGIDAVYLSQNGFQVTSLERNPVLYLLLAEALERSQRTDLKELRFIHIDSLDFLQGLRDHNYEVAYFDPMYPEKKKSALPRKEMQIFRHLVGADEDSQVILEKTLEKDFQRVIVKRPLKAPELLPGTIHSFKGKTVRYDLYVKRN